MTYRRIGLGFVGGGQGSFIGGVHRAAARLDGRFDVLAAAFSSDADRGRASAEACGIAPDRSYPDFRSMAAGEAARADRMDAVAILTPNALHYAVAREFLERGFHVICEKPIAIRLGEALELIALQRRCGRLLAVMHGYTGYAMVRQARALIASGALGTLRVIQVEYAQSWLATALEDTGHVIARRRTDPEQNGAAGCIAAIGSHAFNLAEFVTGLPVEEVSADLTAFVAGRRVPDNAHVMLRYRGGARGMMWISQVAPGHDNGLRLRVYGDRAGLSWSQEDPNRLELAALGEPPHTLVRAGAGVLPEASMHLRAPAGHPEGFIEAIANIYAEIADYIEAERNGRHSSARSFLFPTGEAAARTVRFAEAALASSAANGAWTPADLDLDSIGESSF